MENAVQNYESKIRQIQLCQLDILIQIKKICEKHGITYYLSSGTLLGAVRHHGFIPWDDDVDLEMPFQDYLRFLEIAQKELGDLYYVQDSNTDSNFNRLYTKVRKNNTVMLLPDEEGISGHHGIWVDIFPQIHIFGKVDLKFKRLIVSCCNYLQMSDEVYQKVRKTALANSGKYALAVRDLTRILPESLRRIISRILKKVLFCFPKDSATTAHVWGNISKLRPSDVYGIGTTLKFENDLYSVPSDYDSYLRLTYGDYMKLPPEGERGGHWAKEIKLDRTYQETNASKS